MGEVPVGLVLRAVDVAGPSRWRWLLVDEPSGVLLADHLVELDPGAVETEAFENLYRFLRRRANQDRRVTSEAELVHRVGAWMGSVVLGERIGRAIATAAPVTVRVVVPAEAEFLAFRPLELAHIRGVPVSGWGHVALVYDFPGPPRSFSGPPRSFPGPPRAAKAPVGKALRILAVCSMPTASLASGLRRERYELSRLVHRVATRSRRRVELKVAHHGLTRAMLADLAESGDGWDVLHLSGPGGQGEFLLADRDGSADPVATAELVGLLGAARQRLKLAVVSSWESAAVATLKTLRWLGLDGWAAELKAQVARETTAGLDGPASPVGVARALMTQLDCVVITMRYPVVPEFMAAFTETLYNRMLRNVQPLDRAVAAAVSDVSGPTPSSTRPAISRANPAIFGTAAVRLSLIPPPGQAEPDSTDQALAQFPPEPARFAGRSEVMGAASSALAPESGRTAVIFHGMAGAGKTTCAVELAYRHQHAFLGFVFWSAPADPDQCGDALRLLAVALDEQLADYGVAMADETATPERLEKFLPTLTAVLAETSLLLVLDNLDALLTAEGQWRDLRWVPLIAALTEHAGPSRLLLTSRIVPAGLNGEAVLVQAVHTLSRDESLLLARELPNLRAILHTDSEAGEDAPGTADHELARRVLTQTQGHPQLLELADAAAADPVRLSFQLDEVETALDGTALTAFLTEGATRLDAEQMLALFTAWTSTIAATLPAPARLLLQTVCRIEETDRSADVLGVNWAALWQRLDQPGEPPPLASWIAPLVSAALVTTDPADDPAGPDGTTHYRVHPGVPEAIHAATPEPVIAAVDAQLAAWWTVVGTWEIEQELAGKDTTRHVPQAGLAAARYLLRRHDWKAASCLLERMLIRAGYSPAIALAVIPLLRRIAEATGALENLLMLGAALRKVDPGEAETLLRRAYDQAITNGEYRIASTTAGDLVTLLRDQGRLRDALAMAHRKIEHTEQAGFGFWTQVSDHGRRLQILGLLGHHEQVLTDLPGLRARMADLPDERATNDRVNPGNVREGILHVGHSSAMALQRWDEALELNTELSGLKRRRGTDAYEIACTRFHDYLPLLRLNRLDEADRLLHDCQDAFDAAGDTSRLAAVYGARAGLEDQRDHAGEAVELQRAALRLRYLRPEPGEISTAHGTLADYLSQVGGQAAEQRAHRLAALLLHHLTGATCELVRTRGVLAGELRSQRIGPDEPVLPRTLHDVIRLADTGDGVGFGGLLRTLCPDCGTAEHALADLLAIAATCDQQTEKVPLTADLLLAAWEPIITAVSAAAADGDLPPGLVGLLDDIATTDWVALVAALRRVLAGDRSRELLLAGLDDIGTAVVTATLDRLATHPGQQPGQ